MVYLMESKILSYYKILVLSIQIYLYGSKILFRKFLKNIFQNINLRFKKNRIYFEKFFLKCKFYVLKNSFQK